MKKAEMVDLLGGAGQNGVLLIICLALGAQE